MFTAPLPRCPVTAACVAHADAMAAPMTAAGPAQLERDATRTTARVAEAVAHATAALLEGDRDAVDIVGARRCVIDLECRAIEDAAFAGGHDVGTVVVALRAAADLSAAAGLAHAIAGAVRRVPPHTLTPRVRGLLARIGDEARHLLAGGPRYACEPGAAVLDDLHRRLLAELFTGTVPLAVAVELTLVGRHYERLGAHAVAAADEVAALSRTGR